MILVLSVGIPACFSTVLLEKMTIKRAIKNDKIEKTHHQKSTCNVKKDAEISLSPPKT